MLVRALVFAVAALVALPAAAQDDDLAPLMLIPDKTKAKPKPKVRPKRPKKPKARPKPRVTAPDDELAPLVVAKTQLAIKLAKSSSVSDAEVKIDGKDVGTLPLEPQDVKPGEHTISIKRPGFADFTRKVKVGAGKTVDVTAALKPVAAVVSVTGGVQGADVLFRGKMLGLTPLANVEVPPGTGELVVRKDGYRDETQIITFVAGKDYPLNVSLTAAGATTTIIATSDRPVDTNLTPDLTDEPPPLTTTTRASAPLTSKWYFWAGVAAVGVAVIAGTAVGVSSANTPLSNGEIERRVCEGECLQCIPAGWCDGPVAPGARASAGIVRF